MADPIIAIMNAFRNYNINGDAAPEINSLTYASFEDPSETIPSSARFALVLIEPRVLNTIAGATAADDLVARLMRYKADLRAEGLYSRFIIADVYKGNRNQDGRTIIALRRFFQQVKAAYSKFEGVTLVGSFPEASIVRRWIWGPSFPQTVMGTPRTGSYLAIYPELVSTRSEIVLSDLTGNWESLYQESDFIVDGIIAYPDATTAGRNWLNGVFVNSGEFSSTVFEVRRDANTTFRDVFYIDDASYTVLENRTTPTPFLKVNINSNLINPEIGASDRLTSNKIAQPDISVSRINAWNVALDPDPNVRGTDGKTFLDANGNPQTVMGPANLIPQNQAILFSLRNPLLERKLYNSYFDRNHQFRVGSFSGFNFRHAAISGSTDFQSVNYSNFLANAATDFPAPFNRDTANLAQYVQFFKEPSVLRYIIAHSSMWGSAFNNTQTEAQMNTEVGGPPLLWKHESDRFVPSYANIGGNADLFVHRAMWHNKTLRNSGAAIVVHGGCDVNSAYGTTVAPYNDVRYAGWQNAEGILFYTNTVALLSRAKVFNDSPWGFPEGFRTNDRAHCGSAFANYYKVQSNDAGVSTDYAQNKRPYFWSLIGDWTLRLRNKNALGILAYENGALITRYVHPNKSWIDGWNFDAALNEVHSVGDIDGDGIDEFVLTSSWGIGIGKFNGQAWKTIVCQPKDTWFGGWRYNASVNTGVDKHHGMSNLTGGTAAELLLTSSWGIGALAYTSGTLQSTAIHSNGTRLGGWNLNTADNKIVGTGNFDATTNREIVVTSPWGLGILSLQTSSALTMAANGTRLGGWNLNTADNKIAAIADFDGDGKDEILITSPWGIAILKLVNNSLTTLAIHANGTNLNGYVVKNTDAIWATGRITVAGTKHSIVFANTAGIHVVALNGTNMTRVAGVNNGTRIGGWLLNTADNRCVSVADMNADGKDELVLQSPWGIGLIGFNGTTASCLALHANRNLLGDWYLEGTDKVVGSGNFVGSGTKAEILIRK